ncbi:MAG: DUF2225 domain-containing protein [Promethearchaeia archaeon]
MEKLSDNAEVLQNIRTSIENLRQVKDAQLQEESLNELVSGSIKIAEQEDDLFEAGEFIYAVAELIEEIDPNTANELYSYNIELLNKLIGNYRKQGKLHQIASLYLRAADVFEQKLNDIDQRNEYLKSCIRSLKRESKILLDFNGVRKLTQNYENIAELYVKIGDYDNAIRFFEKVINSSKQLQYFDLLSYSYQQIAKCYKSLEKYQKYKDVLLDGIDYFSQLLKKYEDKHENLATAQIAQILKKLYALLDDKDQYKKYSQKEAGGYINLAENLEKNDENYHKIARYYRGAALCYREIKIKLIESASCFVLAGNYSEKIDEFYDAATNYFDAAVLFQELDNPDMAYKHFVKAADNYWKIEDFGRSTECYLNAYDIAAEGELEFDRFGLFNQIVTSLNKIAREGLKNELFFTAASLILESIKFYEQLDTAKDFILAELVRNVYRYYYRAANKKNISYSHLVQSYIMASISCILIGKMDKALEIISEIDENGKTVKDYKKIVNLIIEWITNDKEVKIEKFPEHLKRLIENSDEILYLLDLFNRV